MPRHLHQPPRIAIGFGLCCNLTHVILIQQQQSRATRVAYHADGVYLEILCSDERRNEKEAANPELPGVNVGRGEVLLRHKQQRGGGQEADNRRPETDEHTLNGLRLHVLHEHLHYQNHQNERRQHKRNRGRKTAKDGHSVAEPGVVNGGISAVSGRIDAYRAGSHLADSHNVGEL